MTTTEHKSQPVAAHWGANAWRDVLQAHPDGLHHEGVSLEQLIDLQRGQAPQRGADR